MSSQQDRKSTSLGVFYRGGQGPGVGLSAEASTSAGFSWHPPGLWLSEHPPDSGTKSGGCSLAGLLAVSPQHLLFEVDLCLGCPETAAGQVSLHRMCVGHGSRYFKMDEKRAALVDKHAADVLWILRGSSNGEGAFAPIHSHLEVGGCPFQPGS